MCLCIMREFPEKRFYEQIEFFLKKVKKKIKFLFHMPKNWPAGQEIISANDKSNKIFRIP